MLAIYPKTYRKKHKSERLSLVAKDMPQVDMEKEWAQTELAGEFCLGGGAFEVSQWQSRTAQLNDVPSAPFIEEIWVLMVNHMHDSAAFWTQHLLNHGVLMYRDLHPDVWIRLKYMMGLICLMRGDRVSAREHFENALSQRPEDLRIEAAIKAGLAGLNFLAAADQAHRAGGQGEG